MLTSPQSFTVNAIAKALNKVSEGEAWSLYRTDDGEFEFKVSHQEQSKRSRRMARLDQTKIAADPLTAVNAYQKAGAYIVIDEPLFGYTDAELKDLVQALIGWLTSANILAVLAGRH